MLMARRWGSCRGSVFLMSSGKKEGGEASAGRKN